MFKPMFSMLKETATGWVNDDAMRMSASLAYYTLFSLAPSLLIIVSIARWMWGDPNAQQRILEEVSTLVSPQFASTLDEILERSRQESATWTGAVIGIVTLLFGASVAFNELQRDLNQIWNVEPPKNGGWRLMVKRRLFAFGVVLGVGVLLALSIAASTTLVAMGKYFSHLLPVPNAVLQLWNIAVSLAIITLLFALLFKVLPDVVVAWRDVWLGAFVTALLFSVGRTAITMYLATSGISSSFGAAGSVVVLLAFIYYSTLIFLFGAEFTQVYSLRPGSTSQRLRESRREKPA